MSSSASTRPKVTRLDVLGGKDLDAWHSFHATNPLLDSPYFHPQFAQAVHASGREVRVVTLTARDGGTRALLAFHQDGTRIRPVGWPGADFQGALLAAGDGLRPLELLPADASSFEFDHLVETSDGFKPWITGRSASPFMDVSGGLDSYLGRASRSGKDNMGQARRRAAKAERELGPVTFVQDSSDERLLDRVIELKRSQYAATGARDYFADSSRRELLLSLLRTRDSSFGGLLSTLHAGEHLIAAHFGLKAGKVLHWWFPVYDPSFANLAPGWILLREIVAAAPLLGIDRIDLGRGDDEYKRRAKTGETTVCQGLVTRSTIRLALKRAKISSIAAAKSSPLGPRLQAAARQWRRVTTPVR
jgi:CelD/BcsL family acetyltransferase involved in cellulose biosynthesis